MFTKTADALKYVRKVTGFTRRKLSDDTGIDYQKLTLIEKGTQLLSVPDANLILKAISEQLSDFDKDQLQKYEFEIEKVLLNAIKIETDKLLETNKLT